MAFTPHPHVDDLLDRLLSQLQPILDRKLVGLYLYGSLVTGDYDDGVSDVDLLAATSGDVEPAEFEALKAMHNGLVSARPAWTERIEIAYLSRQALATFKTQTSTIAIISPGEPFHFKEAGRDWLLNWYMVREKGVTLFGPPPASLIAPVSKAEFIQTVEEHGRAWAEWILDMRHRKGQSYAILTLCRALYALRHGEQVSKLQAAVWAQKEFPHWSGLIEDALAWRRAVEDGQVDHESTFPETVRFVNFIVDRLARYRAALG